VGDEVEVTVIEAAIVDGEDVGVGELAEHGALAQKVLRGVAGARGVARLRQGGGHLFGADDLDGDGAVAQAELLAQVDLAHAATAEPANKAAAAEDVPFEAGGRAGARRRAGRGRGHQHGKASEMLGGGGAGMFIPSGGRHSGRRSTSARRIAHEACRAGIGSGRGGELPA
jgi:hypothetical protein